MERPCPICCCRENKVLYRQCFGNTKAISVVENYDVVACKNCGFIYADNIPPQADFNSYYAVLSKYEFNHKGGIVSNDYIDHFEKIVNFIILHMEDKGAKILDIGCSTGALLSIFASMGYSDLLGIDPSPACVKAAEALYGIKALVSDICSLRCPDKFDLIILSAVLEHLVDFKSSMEQIGSLLKNRGLLFVEVPDVERFDSFISAPFQQFSVEHINYFSQYSLRNFLGTFHFKPIDIKKNESKLNSTLDPDLFVVAEKTEENSFEIVRDNTSEANITTYIANCSKIHSKLERLIQKRMLNKRKVIVWGVGTHTQRLIGTGFDLSKVLFFVDSNERYIGSKLKGIEIRSPNDILEGDIPILISTYSYQEEIVQVIREVLHLDNEIIKIYS